MKSGYWDSDSFMNSTMNSISFDAIGSGGAAGKTVIHGPCTVTVPASQTVSMDCAPFIEQERLAFARHRDEEVRRMIYGDDNFNNVRGIETTEEGRQAMNLYEYAVIYVPENDEGDAVRDEARVLVEPTFTLSSGGTTAVERKALREFADTDVDLDFVRVLVRPFVR